MDNLDVSWQYLSASETAEAFSTSTARGLTEESAAERLKKLRRGSLWEVDRVSVRSIALKYALDGAIIFLLADLLCAAFIGFDLMFLLILALTAAFVAFRVRCDVVLARLARKGAESLVPEALVVRGGVSRLVGATKLVPGDIVILAEGDLVAADMRVIAADSLVVSEKGVTDNDIPVEKTPEALKRKPSTAEPENMSNMLFAFSYVLSGRGRAVVVATGEDTLAAKKGMSRRLEPRTDSSRLKKAERVASLSSSVLLCAALVYVLVGLFAFGGKFGVTHLFLTALSFAVAGFGTVWHSLILSAHTGRTVRLFRVGSTLRTPDLADDLDKCSALVVRDLSAFTEEIPKINAVVTCGRMIESDEIKKDDPGVRDFFKMLALVSGTSDAALSGVGASSSVAASDGAVKDYLRRTEVSLRALVSESRLAGRAPAGNGNPFDTVMYAEGGEYHAVCSGNVERILNVCRTDVLDGFEETLTRDRRERYIAMARDLEERGFRVIALAHRLPPTENFTLLSVIQHSMSFAGFVAVEPVPAPLCREFIEDFPSPTRSILCFASCPSDARFASSDALLADAPRYTVRTVREANAVPIEKGKSLVVCVPDDAVSPDEGVRLRLIIIRRLKKALGDFAFAGSTLEDGVFAREAKYRVCLDAKDRLRPAPYSISNSAHAICKTAGTAIASPATVELFGKSDLDARLALIRKYLMASQLLRAAFFIATLFLPATVPAVTFIAWAFVLDGAVGAFLLYSNGVSDYLKSHPEKRVKTAKIKNSARDTEEIIENIGK